MAIWQQIFWRWLGWVVLGANYGCLAGAIVGGIHGLVFAVAFLDSLNPGAPKNLIENVAVGLLMGGFAGAREGAICGAAAFCIASLLRMKSPHLQALSHFTKTAAVAFRLSILGSMAGAMTAMAGASLAQADIGSGYFYGCQVGFNLGLFCGALAPGVVEKAREACKSLFASARRT